MNGIASKFGLALLVAPLALGLTTPAMAQTKVKPKHHGFLHRAVAGVGAYEIAKHTGKRRVAHGGKRNLLQKHPVLTGLAAYKLSKHRIHKH